MESTAATIRAPSSGTLRSFERQRNPSSGGLGAPSQPAGPSLVPVPGRRLGRQATLSKSLRHMQPPAALPLFDMSVAVLDSLNLMRASMEEEVVLQSALAVPAHHALACRIEAYGTPFGAPPLQAVVQGELSEDDKQFAACLAAPPDADVVGGTTPEFSLQRMASVRALQSSPSLAARGDEAATPAAKRGGGELLRSPSVKQTDKKSKKAAGAPGGMRRGSGAVEDDLLADMDVDGANRSPAAGAAAAVAASAAAARTAPRGAPQHPLAALFQGDAVAALVGTGYLLLRAAGFDTRTPHAVERLSLGLRRQSVERRLSGALACAVADVAVAGA